MLDWRFASRILLQLWQDLVNVILPALIDKAGLVPIQVVNYSNNDFDVTVENLNLKGINLIPRIVDSSLLPVINY